MLQVTPLHSALSNPYSQSLQNNAVPMIHSSVDVTKRSNATAADCLHTDSSLSECGTLDSRPKFNLLHILKASKSNVDNGKVFKPIGNKIVVPLKIPITSKKPKQSSKKLNHHVPNTLQHSSGYTTKTNYEANYLFPNKTVIDMTWKTPTKETPFTGTTTVTKIKKELNFESSAFPTTADQRLNNSRESIDPCNDDKQEVFQLIECFNKLPEVSDNISIYDADSELTCLSWLSNYKSNQLNEILQKCNPDRQDPYWNDDDSIGRNKIKSFLTAYSQIKSMNQSRLKAQYKNDPNGKPPYSFSCLIFMAIEDSETKKLRVKDIYKWFCKHYPYFRTSCSSWKNSIRHNLSLNRCFVKSRKPVSKKESCKNYFWCIHPAYRPNLIESLKRVHSLYPNYHSNEMKAPSVLKNLTNFQGFYPTRLPAWTASASSKFNRDSDTTSAALNLIDLRAKGEAIKSENQADLINHTIDEIFRDTYFQYGFARDSDDVVDDVSDDKELLVNSDYSKEHNYCLPYSIKEPTENRKRCDSLESVKSSPDEAYEFESVSLSGDDLDMGLVQDIMEDIMVGSEDDEKEVLFDSGFGSLRNFERQKSPHKTPTKNSNRKDPSKKSASSRYQNKTTKNIQKRMKSKSLKTRRGRSSGVPKRKAKKICKERKSRDTHHSKTSRNNKLKVTIRRTNNSHHHTRSKKGALPYLETERKSRQVRRSRHSSLDCSNDEEEVKQAAGSLLRLAGLIKPLS